MYGDHEAWTHIQTRHGFDAAQHLNLHIHLNIAEAAAGTLYTSWCKRALDHDIRLHEVSTRGRFWF